MLITTLRLAHNAFAVQGGGGPYTRPRSNRLAEFCRKHHIDRLSLFGSLQRGVGRPESDIDLLVELSAGKEPGLLALATLEAELSELLGGRRVDLRTAQDLSQHFSDEVLRTAEVQYAA